MDWTTRRAKELRFSSTDAELRLWRHLRAHRFMGFKFKRQVPVAGYIVDFLCLSLRLVVELDGGQHVDHAAYDSVRDQCLRSLGFEVLRFWNHQVLSDTESVLDVIRQKVLVLTEGSREAPSP